MSWTTSRKHSRFRRVSDRFALGQVLAVLKQDCRDVPAVGLARRNATGYKDVAQQHLSIATEADHSSRRVAASCGTKLEQGVHTVGYGTNAESFNIVAMLISFIIFFKVI